LEELEFIKDFQQELIIEFEKVTGKEFSKKFLPGFLSDEIEHKAAGVYPVVLGNRGKSYRRKIVFN